MPSLFPKVSLNASGSTVPAHDSGQRKKSLTYVPTLNPAPNSRRRKSSARSKRLKTVLMTTYQNVMPGYLLNQPSVTTSSSMKHTILKTSPEYQITPNWRVVPVPSEPGTSISTSAHCVKPNSKQPNAQGSTPPLTARRLRCSPPEHR